MNFASLHHQNTPLLIANVWDVPSAQAAGKAGYTAIGTSSAAIAATFGYEDGETLSFTQLRQQVALLRAASPLPLTVDMEAGYGSTPDHVVTNLVELANLGVVGVNLEDSIVRQGQRTLLEASTFAIRLQAIQAGLTEAGVSLFINVRTDGFLLGLENALAETIIRGQLYTKHGADGLFAPCVTSESDIKALVNDISLPLNVMCMPELPAFDRLTQLGVKRVSMGNFIHLKLQEQLQKILQDILIQQSFNMIFSDANH